MDGRRLEMGRRKTFILGFKTAVASLIGVGRFVFEQIPQAKYVRGYQLGQDHIETLFSKIRSKSGFNNNPDVITFKSALRSLLVKTDITPSPSANSITLNSCTDGTSCSILMSRTKKRTAQHLDDVDLEQEFEDDVEELTVDLAKPVTDIVEYIGK